MLLIEVASIVSWHIDVDSLVDIYREYPIEF